MLSMCIHKMIITVHGIFFIAYENEWRISLHMLSISSKTKASRRVLYELIHVYGKYLYQIFLKSIDILLHVVIVRRPLQYKLLIGQ